MQSVWVCEFWLQVPGLGIATSSLKAKAASCQWEWPQLSRISILGETNLHMTDIRKAVKIIPRRNDCRKERLSPIPLCFYVCLVFLAYAHFSKWWISFWWFHNVSYVLFLFYPPHCPPLFSILLLFSLRFSGDTSQKVYISFNSDTAIWSITAKVVSQEKNSISGGMQLLTGQRTF